jgi:hypothetical protein
MIHHVLPDHTYHFSSLHPLFISLYFGIFGCIDPRRDCTSFHGKKGLKARGFIAITIGTMKCIS